jgi:hypothetical protein
MEPGIFPGMAIPTHYRDMDDPPYKVGETMEADFKPGDERYQPGRHGIHVCETTESLIQYFCFLCRDWRWSMEYVFVEVECHGHWETGTYDTMCEYSLNEHNQETWEKAKILRIIPVPLLDETISEAELNRLRDLVK